MYLDHLYFNDWLYYLYAKLVLFLMIKSLHLNNFIPMGQKSSALDDETKNNREQNDGINHLLSNFAG